MILQIVALPQDGAFEKIALFENDLPANPERWIGKRMVVFDLGTRSLADGKILSGDLVILETVNHTREWRFCFRPDVPTISVRMEPRLLVGMKFIPIL